jgi:hypothetical protein
VAKLTQPPEFSNDDAEIIIVDETIGTVDRSRRPATGEHRKQLEERLAYEAEMRALLKKLKKDKKGHGRTP